MQRKIIQLGNDTFVVSLPSVWVKHHKLKKGDELEVEEVGWEKTKERYLDYILSRDVYFFMGTESRYNKFLIIGVYYPPRN